MTPEGYSEDELVEVPSIELLGDLGWKTINAFHEFDGGASLLGRETKADVVLLKHLRAALNKLNRELPELAIEQAVEELTRDRSTVSPAEANRQIAMLLRDGVTVTYSDSEGEETTERIKVIDWDTPGNNEFLLVSQFWITGELYTRRADLVGFVNGLPLLFIELKASHRRLEDAYEKNLADYKDTIPQVFWYNGLIILSNGSKARVGSLTASWEHFSEWKRINSEGEQGIISLETTLQATCEPGRLLDILENFVIFQEVRGGLIKVLARNHQYLGVNNSIRAIEEIQENRGRLGVFWHTQGSGKTVSMIFFSQKVLRKIPGDWTFVVVTDRQELDDQAYKEFSRSGVLTEAQPQATNAAHLRQLLTENHRFIFTLIHKYRTEKGEKHPVLSTRSNIVVMADEAHRTQYDILAMNMRAALPNAAFIAFTGTPLIAGEEKTRAAFGDYVSIYDFRQSVEDRATVPLFYENRIPELQITNEHLNDDIYTVLEGAELDDDQERKVAREFARAYHLITRDDRLERIAEDIVDHFVGRGFPGKGMVVCIDKATAVRMYDKVQKYWKVRLKELRAKRRALHDEALEETEKTIAFMEETDMAVVVSQGQGEVDEMRKKGLDITPHRRRLVTEDLDEKFKDARNPLRLVFVCAMWMTGFDVPSCSTIYLDKPMRNHTLMQTIARANRVFGAKVNGLIVDYIGVFRSLEKALAIYGTGSGGSVKPGDVPVKEKAALVEELRRAVADVAGFCDSIGVDLEGLPRAFDRTKAFGRIKLLDDVVEVLLASEDRKRRFLLGAGRIRRLYRAVLPDPGAEEFRPLVVVLTVIGHKIRSLAPAVDISSVMAGVEYVLDRSIAAEGYVIGEPEPGKERTVDLSTIDFDALRKKFETGHRHMEAERLKGTVAKRLQRMVRLNRTRMDYLEKFQRLVEEYNGGAINIEVLFERLVSFAQELSKEDVRALSEELSEEELAIFDLLTKPDMELTKKQRSEVKRVTKTLLKTLKDKKLVLDWRKRQQARAAVRLAIEETLEGLPEPYTPKVFQNKCDAVYNHVFESYLGPGQNIYDESAA